MSWWQKTKSALFIIWALSFIVSIPVGIVGSGALVTDAYPQQHEYEYEVKTQQVMDVDRVEDSDVTPLEQLSDDEREVLYRAFKKQDRFFGSSQVIVTFNDKHDIFTEWRTIETKGVLLLVAVEESRNAYVDYPELNFMDWFLYVGTLYLFVNIIIVYFYGLFFSL